AKAEPDALPETIGDRELQGRELAERLLADVPQDAHQRTDEQRARVLLAHLLDWHRREEKASWWEYYRLRDLPDEDLLDETAAIAGLEFVERVSAKRPVVDRYSFPEQETAIRSGDKLHLPPDGRSLGEVSAIDLVARTLDVKKAGHATAIHPTAVFEHDHVPTHEQWRSLMRLGASVAERGVEGPGPRRAARDLLLRRPPRIVGHAGGVLERQGEEGARAARRLARSLDETTLAIQGPPGSGKTFTGARMICDLVHAGKTVGVCAQSHKVIRNLLSAVVEAAREERVPMTCLQKVSEPSASPHPRIAGTTDTAEFRAALRGGTARVAGGTSWMWAREDFFEAVDVLFVDEAGQMSLANVLAIAPSAKSLVLLGDPRQLEQPIQGLHPEGSAVSALEHVLGDHATIAGDRGLFLEESWRLPPEICEFTSEMFY